MDFFGNARIDYRALFEQMKDDALNRIFVGMMDCEDEDKETFAKFFEVCNRHGVSTETLINIIMDFTKETGMIGG